MEALHFEGLLIFVDVSALKLNTLGQILLINQILINLVISV